jgi:poly-gamma-glutamate capsule biosynthesis protein CapA/YwtB (metallophosphatase superfamily)
MRGNRRAQSGKRDLSPDKLFHKGVVRQSPIKGLVARNLLSIVLALWFFSPAGSIGGAGSPLSIHHKAALIPAGRTVTIDAVGDVMLGSAVADLVRTNGPDAPFEYILPLLKRADGVVGNLECVLSTKGAPTSAKNSAAVRAHKEWLVRGTPDAARGLKDAGFAAVSLANNHTMDYGAPALRDTLVTLVSNGIAPAGAGDDLERARQPALFERAGVRFALIAVSDIIPRGFAAGPHRAGIAPGRSLVNGDIDERSNAEMRAAISTAKRKADVVIVYEHWGDELVTVPSAEQRRSAREAIDAGASVVLGSHSHVLGPIEAYRGGLIAYSLGNFVFDSFPGPGADTEVLQLSFRGGALAQWRTVPATIVGGAPTIAKGAAR